MVRHTSAVGSLPTSRIPVPERQVLSFQALTNPILTVIRPVVDDESNRRISHFVKPSRPDKVADQGGGLRWSHIERFTNRLVCEPPDNTIGSILAGEVPQECQQPKALCSAHACDRHELA